MCCGTSCAIVSSTIDSSSNLEVKTHLEKIVVSPPSMYSQSFANRYRTS